MCVCVCAHSGACGPAWGLKAHTHTHTHTQHAQVLTIGATNLAQELDQALLRPGRFEVVYEIPSPGPTARLEILKYHSRCARVCVCVCACVRVCV